MMRVELILKILTIIELDKTHIQMVLNGSIINFKSKSLLTLIYESRLKLNTELKEIYKYYKILESINNLLNRLDFGFKIDTSKTYNLRQLKKLEFELISLSDLDFDKQFNLLA
ncbi:MAG: hypothetical protein PVG30_02005 [Gammaproteobacteria bacterium]|jgi:hypothetical protein